MKTKKTYALGFAFNEAKTHVILIRKTKPDWQRDRLNGVGGKFEEKDELFINTMVREFEEETSIKTDIVDWHPFACLESETFMMPCYTAVLDDERFYSAKTTTEESVLIVNLPQLQETHCVPNLHWLVPLALDFFRECRKYATITYVGETE